MPDSLHILLDQNVPRAIGSWLRTLRPGWDIRHTSEVGLDNAADDEVFAWAQLQRAVVITFDEDFADSRRFMATLHHGIIRLRIWPTTIEETQSALKRLLDQVPQKELESALVIIGKQHIRIRRMHIP